jgi:hypothetical protein
MANKRTDNTMANRRTDNTMANRRTDNTMAKSLKEANSITFNTHRYTNGYKIQRLALFR